MIMKSMMKKVELMSESANDKIGIYQTYKEEGMEILQNIDSEFQFSIDESITEMKKH